MSSNNDNADLSNLKSRLGLNKSDDKGSENDKSSDSSVSDSSPPSKEERQPKEAQADSPKPDGASSSGGVDDRLAALKESTLKSKKKSKTEEKSQSTAPSTGRANQQQTPDASSSPASTSSGGAGAGAGAGHSGPPVGQGPPPGAQGPPPTSQRPPSRQTSSSRSETSSAGADSSSAVDDADDISLSELGVDDDSMFSGPLIGVMLALLVVGLIFGFLANSSWQTRDMEQARINDASRIYDDITPRLDEFREAHSIIEQLDPTDVDFEAAGQLRDLEFVVDARIYPNNRILFGDDIINPLNRYMGESSVLQQMIYRHYELTTGADREALEAYQQQADEIADDEQVAVVFDLIGLNQHMGRMAREEATSDDYIAAAGRLVVIPDDFEDLEPNEEGEVEVHVLASDAPDRVRVESLVPIVPTDFLDIDGGDAISRYAERVEELQELSESLNSTVPVVDDELNSLATAEPSPLLSFGGGEAATEEYLDESPDDGGEEAVDND